MPVTQNQDCFFTILQYTFKPDTNHKNCSVSLSRDNTVADLRVAIASSFPHINPIDIYALKNPKLGRQAFSLTDLRIHLTLVRADHWVKVKISEVWPEDGQLQDVGTWGYQCFVLLPDIREATVALTPAYETLQKYAITLTRTNLSGPAFWTADIADNFIYPQKWSTPPPPFIAKIDEVLRSPLRVRVPSAFLQGAFGENLRSCNVLAAPGENSALDWRIIGHLLQLSAPCHIPSGALEKTYNHVYFGPLSQIMWLMFKSDDKFQLLFNRDSPLKTLTYTRFTKTYNKYHQKNDVAIWYHGFPRLLVEIESDRQRSDRVRMILVASEALRVTRAQHSQESDLEKLVIPVIYLSADDQAERLLLYLDNDAYDVPTVLYTQRIYDLKQMKDRMSFLCELYQLAKYIHEHPYQELDVVTSVVGGLMAGAVAGFPSLTPTTLGKRRRTESDTDTGRTRTAPQMQDAELEASGFVPVQDACCDELNLRDHLPGHVHLVRRTGQEEILVLKQTRTHELEILKAIRDAQPSCPNVVSLLEIVKLSTGPCALLPRRQLVSSALSSPPAQIQLLGRFLQLAEDLIHGMTFIHNLCIAHLDIKPDNLVYTDKGGFHLEIIDFDISVQLSHIDDVIDTYCGTEDYRAPEIGSRDDPRRSYSPIRADKYSVGCVLVHFAEAHGDDDQGLMKFAKQLLDEDPTKRPPLSEWLQLRKGRAGSKRPVEELFEGYTQGEMSSEYSRKRLAAQTCNVTASHGILAH